VIIPQYSTRYCIQYRCIYMIISSKTGPTVPRPPSIDSNKDREMDFQVDDQRDYMDQDIPGGDLPTVEPGPILTGMPDWMNMSTEDLNIVLESLRIPLEGPVPPGISLQGAIQVNQRHDIYNSPYLNIA
jgi:hypothetical protein